VTDGLATDVDGVDGGAHRRAAAAFRDRVADEVEGVVSLVLFGSTARDEAIGLASDVDFLVVLESGADRERVADRLRELAYDVTLSHGPVVEVHVLNREEFDHRREAGDPFVARALADGEHYDV
jgi:predicted nucleotidyltransferase